MKAASFNLRWLSLPLIALTIWLGYFVQQDDFLFFIFPYALFFATYLFIFRKIDASTSSTAKNLQFFIYVSILLRFLLLFGLPNLSDDVYRFIWDGRLLVYGHNPFDYLPSSYIENNFNIPGIDQSLFDKLNSPEYFTIYPPVAQGVFAFACWLFPNSILGSAIVMKVFIFCCELGSLFFIRKLLLRFQLPAKNILLYGLNPLIIIELCGNLHFEAAMIFFLLAAVYFFYQKENTQSTNTNQEDILAAKRLSPLRGLGGGRSSFSKSNSTDASHAIPPPAPLKGEIRANFELGSEEQNSSFFSRLFGMKLNSKNVVSLISNKNLRMEPLPSNKNLFTSATLLALSVASKLLPLMFFPFFLHRLGWKKSVQYFAWVGFIIVLLFAPLLSGVFFDNFGKSLDLYFQKFEFNASIYYILRWIGFQIDGYNWIQSAGPALAVFVLFCILTMAFLEPIQLLRRKNGAAQNLFKMCLFSICLYLACATIVHPWYVSLPVVLCLFTRFRFPILWSGLVFLTYVNYSYGAYFENLWMVAIEYVLVFGYFIYEFRSPSSD